MTDRYAPPRSRVSDQDESPPKAVRVAVAFVSLLVLVECYHQVAGWEEVDVGERSMLSWIVDWLGVGLLVLIAFMLKRGRNWARWVLLVVTLYQVYTFIDAMMFLSAAGAMADEMVTAMSRFMVKLGPMLAVAATILVFGPGRGWFAR